MRVGIAGLQITDERCILLAQPKYCQVNNEKQKLHLGNWGFFCHWMHLQCVKISKHTSKFLKPTKNLPIWNKIPTKNLPLEVKNLL